MFLIVGLGNPGKEYENTRHNAGFMAVDAIAEEYSFAAFKSKFDGEIAEGKIGGEKVFILKPHTYMNLSGNAVVKAASFYKILPALDPLNQNRKRHKIAFCLQALFYKRCLKAKNVEIPTNTLILYHKNVEKSIKSLNLYTLCSQLYIGFPQRKKLFKTKKER